MGWLSEEAVGSPEAACVLDVLKRWKRAADDLLCSVDDPLQGLPFCCRAAGKPQRDVVAQH